MEGLALGDESVDTSSVRIARGLGGFSGLVGACDKIGGGIDCPSSSGCCDDCGLGIGPDVADGSPGV